MMRMFGFAKHYPTTWAGSLARIGAVDVALVPVGGVARQPQGFLLGVGDPALVSAVDERLPEALRHQADAGRPGLRVLIRPAEPLLAEPGLELVLVCVGVHRLQRVVRHCRSPYASVEGRA